MRTFKTSFGKEIPFVAGYRSAHRKGSAKELLGKWPPGPMTFQGFCKDLFEFRIMMDFLTSIGVFDKHMEKGLEIGGAEGAISRLLKGKEMVRHVTCIEVHDMKNQLSDARFNKLLGRVRLQGCKTDRCVGNFGHYLARSPSMKDMYMSAKPTLDRYIVGDVYNLNETFDWISAFLCMEYFDLEEFFPKVCSLLNNGGIFFFLVNNWWWPVNSTWIVGDFPYACQRLTRDDLEKYFNETYPDETQDILKRYDYFHKGKQHPTLDDCVEMADQSGLSFLSARRLTTVLDSHVKTPITPAVVNTCKGSRLADVLEDIHTFNPSVRLADIQTTFLMGVFKKRPCGRRPLGSRMCTMNKNKEYGIYRR